MAYRRFWSYVQLSDIITLKSGKRVMIFRGYLKYGEWSSFYFFFLRSIPSTLSGMLCGSQVSREGELLLDKFIQQGE